MLQGFSASSDALAFRAVSPGQSQQLTWLDQSGKTDSSVSVGPGGGSVADVDLSRDGKRILISRLVNAANWGIWLIDNARGVATRLTFDADSLRPVWSPDGSRVVFQSNRTGNYHLYSKLSNGPGQDELLLKSDEQSAHRLVIRRTLLAHDTQRTNVDLADVREESLSFPETRFDKGRFTDGRWIASESDESGRFEIYAQPFPGPGGKIRISTGGGGQAAVEQQWEGIVLRVVGRQADGGSGQGIVGWPRTGLRGSCSVVFNSYLWWPPSRMLKNGS